MEQAFYDLDAPVARVCSAEVPIPYAKHLEDAALPQPEKIVAAAQEAAAVERMPHDDRVQAAVARRRHGRGHAPRVEGEAGRHASSAARSWRSSRRSKAAVEVEIWHDGHDRRAAGAPGETRCRSATVLATLLEPGETARSARGGQAIARRVAAAPSRRRSEFRPAARRAAAAARSHPPRRAGAAAASSPAATPRGAGRSASTRPPSTARGPDGSDRSLRRTRPGGAARSGRGRPRTRTCGRRSPRR